MKFCPNCGFPIEGKSKCNCGYDVETGEVDSKVFEDYKNKEKTLYENSSDNMSMMSGRNQSDVIFGAHMMGINPNLSDEELLKQLNQPIFNKENDNLFGEALVDLMKNTYEDRKDSSCDNQSDS